MKRLAVYVQHLTKYNGQALTLSSGAPVSVRFATGDRASTQSVEHAQIVAMIQEAAPPVALADIRGGRPGRFTFDEDGAPVMVEVTPSGSTWRVVITPMGTGGAIDALPTQSPPLAPAPPPPPASVRGIESWDEGGTPSIDRWLRMVTKAGGSDLHVSSNNPPMFRLHGEMRRLEETAPWDHERLKKLIYEIMPVRNREEFEKRNDTDWAHEIVGLARFRANAFMDRRGICAVLRRIPYEILSPEQLGLPRTVLDLCNLTKGLVVVTGPTGSGKSTTLATLIDVINRTRDE
ncbi:MAG: ATPase, T2SS/T4P/T4SS family, partial [Deltaproteobacteria bacterium]